MSGRNKILVAAVWNPALRPDMKRFVLDASGLFDAETFDAELFVSEPTKKLEDMEAAAAIFVSELTKATEWALYGGFTHMLIVDPSLIPDAAGIAGMLSRGKDIVVAGQGGHGFSVRNDKNESNWGFGLCLLRAEIGRRCPLKQAYGGEFLSPWKCWAKFAQMIGMRIWVDYDVKPLITTKRG